MTGEHPVLIDCDPGIDDAIMLTLALVSPELDIRAITTVAGNVPLDLTSRNARIIRQQLKRPDIPVFAGCPRPMLRMPVSAEAFHGNTGLGETEVFDPCDPAAQGHGVGEIIRQLRRAPDDGLTLIVTGPMTNIACALIMAPDVSAHIREIILMGGARSEGGNITATAEFNIFADPHAASVVFDAGIKITVLSLDVTHQVRATPDRIRRIEAIPGQPAALVTRLLRSANQLEARARPGQDAPMHDPSTILYLLAPEIFATRRARVRIATAPGRYFGQTRVSHPPGAGHQWVTEVDETAFFRKMEEILDQAS